MVIIMQQHIMTITLIRGWRDGHLESKAMNRRSSSLLTVMRLKIGYCRDVPSIQ